MRAKTLLALASGIWLGLLAFSSPAATFDLNEVQKLVANDPTEWASFGSSIALSGDTAVIGAAGDNENRGAAYVFAWNGSTWGQQAKLTVADSDPWDRFGGSVSIDGGTIVIGAPGESDNAGAAYVFTWEGSAWTQQARLDVPNPYTYRGFGNAVIVTGDTAMVTDLDGTWGGGAVHVFTRTGTSWALTGKLLDPMSPDPTGVGHAMAIDGDRMIIGAYGGAYVFTWSGSAWLPLGTPITGPAGIGFGDTVSIDGDTVIIGARLDNETATLGGAAYVFTWNGSAWVEEAKLTSADCEYSDQCGGSVAVQGDIALVGAQFLGAANEGAVQVFARVGGLWSPQGKLIPSALSDSNWFFRLAMRDATVMVGATGPGVTGPRGSGSVHVFSLPSSTDEIPPDVTDVTANDVVYPADAIVTATATDLGSNIKSADYSLDGGGWTAMDATDEDFDEKSEGLTATIAGPLSVDSYDVCVRATDAADNTSDGEDCDTFKVTAAAMTITFGGEYLDLNGAPTLLNASVSGPDACKIGATVDFYDGTLKVGEATTNSSGTAQLSPAMSYGVHEITVVVLDRDFDENDAAECTGDVDAGSTVAADPNAASSGGGWYKVDGVAPPRVNFGYVANVKYNKKTQEFVTTGNLLWMNQDNFKLKGVINQSGKFDCPTSDHVQCAVFGGTGVVYEHNDSYDPAFDPPSDEWIGNSPLEVSFVATVYDGGSSTVCQKKRCTVTERPDAIMMQIHGASIPAAPYEIITLQGGSITVKK